MADKPKNKQVNLRISSRTYGALEDFADKYEYNNAEAVRTVLKARLAAEGELDDPSMAMTDGGTEIENKLSELDNEVQDIQIQTQTENRLLVLLFAAVVWLGVNITVELGTLLTVLTGVPLIAGLVYLQYKKYL